MKNQWKIRLFSIVSIFSMLLAAVGVPTGVVHAASTVTISGALGELGAGATITANGNWGYDDSTATADGSGNYSVTVDTNWLSRWSGEVTPSKTGYSFSPSSRDYNSITSNQTNQNYTTTLRTYTISGSVGSAGGGATISWTGETTGSTTASGSGSYSFTVPHGWDGTVIPTKAGYTFSPASRNYTNVTANDSNENYTATPAVATISGSAGVASATITYTGGSTTANSSGNYSFTVPLGWSGTVTPSRTGYSFVPPNRSYTDVTVNQSAQDYTARPSTFTFGAISDAHAQTSYFSATADQLAALNPALVLYNGDLENDGFVPSEMNSMVNILKSENLFNKTFLVRGNADNDIEGSAGLWESYFETAPNIPSRPAFVVNKVALNSSSDYLNYSFDYGNSIFIGLDVPGDIDYLTQAQMDFLDARLTYAEGAGLTHAFIFFHGPAYPVESIHSLCSARADASCTPPALMTIINNHPIVSATLHGHEHVLAWTHMDATRVGTLTRSYEQFITSPAGGASYHEYLLPERVDYAYTDMDNSNGFATIAVNGLEFTYRIYKTGTSQPVWSHTFSKINTPPTISNITDQTTAEDTATAAIPFTVGDVETSANYLTVTASSSDTTVVPNDHIALGGSGANRTLSITPGLNQSGTATITVSVNDGNVTVDDTFVVTVNPVNDAPVADPQSLIMPWDTSLNIVLTGSDVENSPLTFDIVDDPDHGSLTGSGAERTYTPAAGYSGPDSFTFKASDADLDSLPATVSILVTAHTISGNAGVAGATLSYIEGATPKTVTADGTGAYSFQVPAGWSGTVTPSKAGYNFSPASMTYTDVQADQTDQNYSVSGVMIVISGNAGVAGATLSYVDGTPKTVTADESGLYSFEVPYNWSGTVTPSKTDYGFRPGTKTYTSVIEDRYAEDYITHTHPTYYVDNTNPNCTDVGQVGSFAVPFCTITRGAYLATAGRVVHVLHGTYPETVYPERSGTAQNPIRYWADPGVVVTGQPGTPTTSYAGFAMGNRSYIEIDGFHIDNTSYKGIYVDASHHITITNNHVTRAGESSQHHPFEQGIYLKGTTYSTISYNTTDHNTCIGIRLVLNSNYNLVSYNLSHSNYSFIETDAAGIETTGASYNTIINNITYSNEDSGINIYLHSSSGIQSTHNLVINNLSYENGDHGIDVNNSPYNTIVGNTVHGNGTVGINVEGDQPSTASHHTILANNITASNGFTPPAGSFGGNLRVDSASLEGTTSDYTIIHRESPGVQIIWNDVSYPTMAAFQAAVPTQELHGLEADPLFVDPVPPALRETGVPYLGAGIIGNYYPNVGSPAIDSANSDAPQHQSADIDGNSRVDDPGTPNTGAGVRTYDDRGAYEYLPAGPSLPVITTQAVTDTAQTTVTCNGTIAATGLPNPTQHGCVWATHAGPTTDDSKTTDGPAGAPGAFTSNITGLTPGTLYFVRAYATNTVGTAYGEEVTFTTHLLPGILTQAVTNVSTTTATGNGNITVLGIPNPTQHGVVWSTSPNPTTADSKTTDGPVSAIGVFTSNIAGLTPGTLYYVRAYVTNAAGTVYGNDFTFTTHVEPAVTTQAVTNITMTTATGNGNVTTLGMPNPTQHGVVWSTSPNPTTANSKTTDGPVSATGAFTSNITGLTPGTLYYVRAYATNEVGTVYGSEVTFTALQLPALTTQAATNVTSTTATGNGNITALGVPNPTEHGVVWSTIANPTIADNKTTDGAVGATGTFISSITGLTPGTLYHVRAYATNAAGTSYGNDVTFTTDILPTVTTQAVTSITQTTATGNGNVTALGVPNPTEHGVVWSTLPNPTTADHKTIDGAVSATGAFTSAISGLTPGTLYHVRAYATNEVGTAYGEDVTFTTLLLPAVTTQPVTAITTTTATGNGNITALGIPNPTQHGIVWSTSPNPTTADSKTTNGPVSATGAFTGNMTGLAEGTLYHVRAYATNAAGTVYGDDVTFTTLLRPGVTTQGATEITQTTATGHGTITVLGSSNPTEHGLVWSTSPNPTTSDYKTAQGAVTETGAFTGSLTGLTPGTLYHVRAYAINAAGTSYGEDLTFTTLLLPTVTTMAVTDITETTATGNGNIDVLGIPNPTQHGMVWSTSPNPTTADSKTTDGAVSVTGPFTSSMTGLVIGTQYYVRAYATNAAGTVYGNEVTFTTTSTSSGTTTPATDAGTGTNVSGVGTIVWLSAENITSDDNSYALVNVGNTPPSTTQSQYLYGTDYGFDIPANAIINGVQVTIGRYESGSGTGNDVRDSVVKLLKGGMVVGGNKAAAGTEWPTAEANAVYGSNNDLWGSTWTPAEINASDFGVALSVNSANNRIAYVDFMQVAVTYTVTQVGSITTVNCGAGTPVAIYGSSITCVATVTRGSGTFTPTGNVSWTTNGSGSFTPTSCSIAGSNGVATCSVTYTPSAVGSGSHLVTASYAGDPGFYASNGNQTLTINKKAASVAPDALSKTYGDPDPELTGTLTGFLPADNVTATYSRTPGDTVAGSPYTISATLSPAGALANYNITYYTDELTIAAKPVTITPNAGQTKVFGDSDPLPFTYTHTALVGTDALSGALGRVSGEVAGTYAYTLGTLDAGTNYVLSIGSEPATFSITPRPITVTANEGQSKVLGAADPVFTYTSSDPAATFSGALERDPGEGIGTYAIRQGTLDAGSNYAITFVSSLFSITPPTADYTLTIHTDHGAVVKEPDQDVYHYDDTVTLTATADYGWEFESWSGDLVSEDNPASIVVHGNMTVTANYVVVSVPPLFTSTPVTAVNEDAAYTYNITTSDPNLGDILAISAISKPTWLSFTDNGDGTALLTGTPTNAEVGSYQVLLRVSDGTLTTDQPFSIVVTNTNDAPSFTSTEITTATEDEVYTYEITTTDPDLGDTLTITAPVLPDWLTLTDHADGTATLTGTPTNEDVAVHDVTLRVDDGTVEVDQVFTIDVGNVNDGPSFTSTPVISVDEDALYTYEITATDPDTGDLLTISASTTLPAWLTLTDHGNRTATLTGTPANGDVGNLDVTLQVSDSVEVASQPFTITVVNINDAPVLTQPADQTNEQGDVVSLQLSANDVDLGDTLTYSASDLPEGLSLDTETGLITGEITAAVNTYTVTVGVDDGHGGIDSKTFNWNVTGPTYTLTILKVGNGTVTPDVAPPYYLNDEVILTAVADEGWTFSSWDGCTATDNTCSVTMDGDKTVTATFVYSGTAPVVTLNPIDQVVASGEEASFSAEANGDPIPTIKWQVSTNGGLSFSDIPGANSNPLTFTAQRTDSGKLYRAVFTNEIGSAMSTPALLGVLPGEFSKSVPFNGAKEYTTSPILSWGISVGATSYEYCYDTTNDGACSNWVNTGTTRSASLSGLLQNTTYYWQVRALNSYGNTYANGSETTYWAFRTGNFVGNFSKSLPPNGSTGQLTSPILTWGISVGATSYEYCYDTTNDGACSNWVSTGMTRSASLSGLLQNTTYYWQVRAINSYGNTYANSSETAYWSFKTGLVSGAFSKSLPYNGITGQLTNPILVWGISPRATSYEYCYDTTNDGACSNWVSTGMTRSASLSGLELNTTYYWQVRAINDFGTTYANGTQADFWYFKTGTVPGMFDKGSPYNGSIGQSTSLTLVWGISPRATSYEYCYDTTNDGVCSNWVSTGMTRSASLSGLDPNTIYYWQVRAINSFGVTYANGSETAFWRFTTRP